jgi:hypothetical protein
MSCPPSPSIAAVVDGVSLSGGTVWGVLEGEAGLAKDIRGRVDERVRVPVETKVESPRFPEDIA